MDQQLNNNENSTSFKNMPSKKSPNKLIAGIIIAVLIIGALGYIFYYKNQQQKLPTIIPGETEKEEIQITRQENFYGINGKILEIRDNAIVIETTAIPYYSFNPSSNDKWVWTISINENTEIIKLSPNENVSETAGEEEHFTKKFITINGLGPDDFVTITSNNDIGTQFPLDEKNITASKIEAY